MLISLYDFETYYWKSLDLFALNKIWQSYLAIIANSVMLVFKKTTLHYLWLFQKWKMVLSDYLYILLWVCLCSTTVAFNFQLQSDSNNALGKSIFYLINTPVSIFIFPCLKLVILFLQTYDYLGKERAVDWFKYHFIFPAYIKVQMSQNLKFLRGLCNLG